jgi:DNA-binding XRE family transcriptional regulator
MKLKDFRESIDLTQSAFGKLLNPPATQASVNQWENGVMPRRDRIINIKEVTFGKVTANDFIEGE